MEHNPYAKSSFVFKEYAGIVVGSFLIAVGVALFNVPAKIVDGGASGIATILHYLKGWDVGAVRFAITLPLFLLGLISFGRRFAFKSLFGSLVLSLFISLLHSVFGYGGMLDFTKDTSTLLSALAGGTISGLGLGLVMKNGGNNGGTEILAQVLSHHTPLTQGTALFLIDASVIIAGGVCFGMEFVIYGTLTSILDSVVADYVIMGFGRRREHVVLIISSNPWPIAEAMLKELGYGGTILEGAGMYEHKGKKVIMSVIPASGFGALTKLVHQEDDHAFMVDMEARDVLGGDFSSMEEAAWLSEIDTTQTQS